jgi:tetratricopeptide (TPR) repeat protein
LERLREAEALAEHLNDNRRRGEVRTFMTVTHSLLGELDEALASGACALTIARELEDPQLRSLAMTYVAQAHYFRGEYERAVQLAVENLAAPADRAHGRFGLPASVPVYDRQWLVLSLAQLGRFAEGCEREAEAIRLAEATHHAFPISQALFAGTILYLVKGDWETVKSLSEHWVATARTGNVVIHLAIAIASSAWILAQLRATDDALKRLREGEQLLETQHAKGIVGHRGLGYHALGRACLLLGQRDEAQRLGERAAEVSPHHPGYAAYALHLLGIATHPTGSTRSTARPTTARRWRSPRPEACAPSLPTATSASASSTGGRADSRKRTSTSPPQRRCTATWTCASGWSRRKGEMRELVGG